MIKMIALDLDNTLLMKDLTVPQDTIDVLRAAAEKGAYLASLTIRSKESACPRIPDFLND